MKKSIVGYLKDDENHWVAKLSCGHYQHVRHMPPWVVRPWVITDEGRESMLGHRLDCKKCDLGLPKDVNE
ncbi:DUF3565 domain-containing protein [Shewanella violacea]|uniref:Pressure-regulated protein n=2 Tax=Shewanella violacea TaxID=60217 RepID=D4ZFP6_SHEVD|nr:DUF3565 domain-containing protein [Shewanella violacea]BAA11902.1 unnamed protein product [Shewanella violacea DSS12]BAJ00495.1 conserved hypothetical protein [Shewanella violacea DSS12]